MQKNNEQITWKPMKKKCVFKTRIMDINEQEAISPEGNTSTYVVLDAPDWVITIPFLNKEQALKDHGIHEDCFLMVTQWRHGSAEISIEFPGGVVDKGEEPLIGAKRELLEETGYRASEIICLGSINPNPAIYSNTLHVYYTESMENCNTRSLDDDEFVNLTAVPVNEVIDNMGKKPYIHALMGTALMYYMQHKR